MSTLLDKLKQLFQQSPPSPEEAGQPEAQLDPESLQKLMQLVEHTDPECYSCEEAFDLLDEYAELMIASGYQEELMPLVRAHLDRCSGCQQQYDMLVAILDDSAATSAS